MTTPKRKPSDALSTLPDLVHHRDIAKKLGISAAEISRWVRSGRWPEPVCRVAATMFYRATDVRHLIETGRWPPHMTYWRRTK